jgi:hypothetical protein
VSPHEFFTHRHSDNCPYLYVCPSVRPSVVCLYTQCMFEIDFWLGELTFKIRNACLFNNAPDYSANSCERWMQHTNSLTSGRCRYLCKAHRAVHCSPWAGCPSGADGLMISSCPGLLVRYVVNISQSCSCGHDQFLLLLCFIAPAGVLHTCKSGGLIFLRLFNHMLVKFNPTYRMLEWV